MNISVVFPIHNLIKLNYLINAFESILNQTYKPFEIIFIKDGMLNTELNNYLSELESKTNEIKIKIITNSKNSGPGFSRNVGVQNSSCEFIAFMDADDYSIPKRFELQINYFLANKHIDILGGQIEEYDESLFNFKNKRFVPIYFNQIKNEIKYRNTVNNVTVMIKKNVFESLGGFPDLFFGEDYVLWIKAIDNNYKIHNLNDTLVLVRTSNNFVDKRVGLKNFINNLKLFSFLRKTKSVGMIFSLLRLAKVFILLFIPNILRKLIFLKFNR